MTQFAIPLRRHPMTLLVWMLVAFFALWLASCGGRNDRLPEPGDVAVARIEGQTIWASDVKREAVAQGLVGEDEPLDTTSDLFTRVLDEVIDQKLLARAAERRGLDRSPLAERRLQATRERILADMLIEDEVTDMIDERRVSALYEEQMRQARTSEEIRARLILSASRAEADAVIGMLAQGAAFEAIAQERSIDEATKFSGGDLGYSTPEVMPQAYAQALADRPVGSVVGPFETRGGWAVLKVEDRRAETPPTLDQARPQIVRYLTYEGVRRLLEELRGSAKIERLVTPAPAPQTPAPGNASPTAPAKAPPAAAARATATPPSPAA